MLASGSFVRINAQFTQPSGESIGTLLFAVGAALLAIGAPALRCGFAQSIFSLALDLDEVDERLVLRAKELQFVSARHEANTQSGTDPAIHLGNGAQPAALAAVALGSVRIGIVDVVFLDTE